MAIVFHFLGIAGEQFLELALRNDAVVLAVEILGGTALLGPHGHDHDAVLVLLLPAGRRDDALEVAQIAVDAFYLARRYKR